MQIILGLLVLAIAAVALFILYRKRKLQPATAGSFRANTLEYLMDKVKHELTEATREDEYILSGDADYDAVMRSKLRLMRASRNCVYGIPADVQVVKAVIRNVIEWQLPEMNDVNSVIEFSDVFSLEPMIKWEILVILLTARLGNRKVLQYLESNYSISKMHMVNDGITQHPRRCFDADMLDSIFIIEVSQDDITYAVAVDVVVELIYQRLKGLGCVNTIRSLPIDGFHFGTSGSIRYIIEGNWDIAYKSTNSVWVQINAKWVHFSFLDFKSEGEMARVTNLISSWGHAAPMNEKSAYKVNDAYDGARITTIRPPAGECWATFVRMFSLSVRSLDWLLSNNPKVKNWELPKRLMHFLMKAEETTAFTGQQNTGKTTMMAAAIEEVDLVNIRVLEMSFELALREIYPDRDILTVKPTDYVSSAELQDVLKKTDAYLSMVGEVAQDIVAARMIQFCLIASAFTIFSHHGKDDPGLINGLAQSLVACGEYHDHEVAMSTVLDAIKNNVHLNFMDLGTQRLRYIEYISEIHKESTLAPYPELTDLMNQARAAFKKGDANELAQTMLAYSMLTREYYTRRTDRVRFTSRKIVVFNRETLTYEPNEWYSPETFERIVNKLHGDDRREFLEFYYDNWRKGEPNPFNRSITGGEDA